MAAPMLSKACPAVRMAVPKLLTMVAAMSNANFLRYQDPQSRMANTPVSLAEVM
jgi:hypothetical protein